MDHPRKVKRERERERKREREQMEKPEVKRRASAIENLTSISSTSLLCLHIESQ